jgi:hypothetical protein
VKHFGSLIVFINDTAAGSGELNRVTDDGAKNHLEIESRADRLADVSKRLEFSNGSRQLARPCLQFLEQPHVSYDHTQAAKSQTADAARRRDDFRSPDVD